MTDGPNGDPRRMTPTTGEIPVAALDKNCPDKHAGLVTWKQVIAVFAAILVAAVGSSIGIAQTTSAGAARAAQEAKDIAAQGDKDIKEQIRDVKAEVVEVKKSQAEAKDAAMEQRFANYVMHQKVDRVLEELGARPKSLPPASDFEPARHPAKDGGH